MLKWSAMCADTTGLQEELEACTGKLIIDDVRMPDNCGGGLANIEFVYYGANDIELRIESEDARYLGRDRAIRQWLQDGSIGFGSYDALERFLHKFSVQETQNEMPYTDTIGQTNSIPEPPVMRYDRDKLTVPECGKNYVCLDKDRLTVDLGKEILGQKTAIEEIAHLVCNFLGSKGKSRPLSVFLYGPTGVGKSAAVEALVQAVNRQTGDEYLQYKPIDCTQFQDHADISRLIGAAPGYVGFTEPGVFACLERNKNTVFVFEEIEKAAPNATQVIMQALETGRQDTNGKTLENGDTFYDLSRSIVFFTSNINPAQKEKKPLGFCDVVHAEQKKTDEREKPIAQKISEDTEQKKKSILETGRFLPEVLGRMHAVIRFEPLSGDVVKDIAAKSIRDVAAKSHLLYITELGTDILQDFINATADKVGTFGVRTLRHAAEQYFGDAFREFSHTHKNYETITVSGDLKYIVIQKSENRQEKQHA